MKALIQGIPTLKCMGNFVMNCMFRSPQHAWEVIFHSHPSFVLESTLIPAVLGLAERYLSWLSNDSTFRTIRSELRAQEGFECWDFQASICLVLLLFCYGSLMSWRATGLDRSPLFRNISKI
jgi:hypothetical protein